MSRSVFAPYQEATLEDYEPHNASQASALASVKGYLQRMDLALEKGLGLTFIGPPGVGKTMLASVVMREVALAHVGSERYSGRSIEMASWIGMYHRKFELSRKTDDPEVHNLWLRLYKGLESIRSRYTFVLLDDVGKEYESGSGWSTATFDELLRFRFNQGLPTILTSNLDLEEWTPRYSSSLESFLHQSSIIIGIDGPDQRKE